MNSHRIILVDDDAEMLVGLKTQIGRLFPGCSIASFPNATEALAHLLQAPTDLLITNHSMTDMSGTELIARAREQQIKTPILMISGAAEMEKKAKAAGADAFLDKTAGSAELESTIRKLLNGSATS